MHLFFNQEIAGYGPPMGPNSDDRLRQKDISSYRTLQSSDLGFERDHGKVLIHRGIEGQGINTPFPFTLYYQGGAVLPLSRGQKMFSTGAKV